jgi:hypothetical protein
MGIEAKGKRDNAVSAARLPEWRRVQLFPNIRPSRQRVIHDGDKSVIMMPLNKMNHFVDNDILETMVRLLDQFEV